MTIVRNNQASPVSGSRPRGLRALVTATAVSSLGDGAFLAAAPLAAAAITRSPAAVAAVAVAEYLPWLLVSPFAGALVDRWNRRTVLIGADLLRGCALAGLTVIVATGAATIPILAVIACLAVIGQIFADTASQTLVADLAGRNNAALNSANGAISSANTAGKSLIGPPAGSLGYALFPWLPFLADAVSFLGSAALLTTLPKQPTPAPSQRQPLLASIAEGARFLFRHRQLRALCALIAAANLANFMALSTFVLYAGDELHVSTAGFGVLIAVGAVGGIAGGFAVKHLVKLLGPRTATVIGLAAQAIAWPAIAATSSPYLAGAALLLAEFGAAVATVIVITARQELAPAELLGRVTSAFRTIGAGAAPLGALIGGLLAGINLHVPLIAAGVVLVVAIPLFAGHVDARGRA